MNTFGIQERETTITKKTLLLTPMPTFLVFLDSFSELPISLSHICEFRRLTVIHSRVI